MRRRRGPYLETLSDRGTLDVDILTRHEVPRVQLRPDLEKRFRASVSGGFTVNLEIRTFKMKSSALLMFGCYPKQLVKLILVRT